MLKLSGGNKWLFVIRKTNGLNNSTHQMYEKRDKTTRKISKKTIGSFAIHKWQKYRCRPIIRKPAALSQQAPFLHKQTYLPQGHING